MKESYSLQKAIVTLLVTILVLSCMAPSLVSTCKTAAVVEALMSRSWEMMCMMKKGYLASAVWWVYLVHERMVLMLCLSSWVDQG